MLRAPLSVRINDGRTDRHVTRHASGLKYRRTAPGGYADAGVRLDLDPADFDDLGPADKMIVAGPTGRTLWEGFLENPASTAGREGQALDLSAIGTAILGSDRSQGLIYVDRDLGRWEPYAKNVASASASTSTDPSAPDTSEEDGLLVQFNQGQPIGTDSVAAIGYTGFRSVGMQVGGITARVKSGKVDTGYRNELVWNPPTGSTVLLPSTRIDTDESVFLKVIGEGAGHPTPGTTAVSLRLRRTGAATNIADDNTWSWFSDISVVGRRMNRYGALLSGLAGLYSADYVFSHWVVEDLLGRCLAGLVDAASSIVEAGTFPIDQLAYADGRTMAQVLDDLARYEPDLLWEILEHTGAGYRFNYRRWPSTVRYEVTTRDGYTAPGSDVDLCNRVAVFWTDAAGAEKSVIVRVYASTYPALSALEDAGRVRDAPPIRLPDGRGSLAAAVQIGEQTLAAAASLSKAARVKVARPVFDLLKGGWAMPYELEPGYLVRVRDTGDVLRCTEVEYGDDEGAADLVLGEPELTLEQRVARLAAAA